MLTYAQIAHNEKEVLALTGCTCNEFSDLIIPFEQCFLDHMSTHTIDGIERLGQRYSTYRSCPLKTIEDKLLFILVYVKQSPTQTLHGRLFGISQSNANKWIHLLHTVLNKTLKKTGDRPHRSMSGASPQPTTSGEDRIQGGDESPTILFFHDATERPIQRPSDDDDQRLYYSGKKKLHTMKNIILIDERCIIFGLSETYPGSVHDKHIADEQTYTLPAGCILYQDRGFQGFSLDTIQIKQPKKKPIGDIHTEETRRENTRISQVRIRIEHVIGRVKRYRIVKDTLRLWRDHIHDTIMETCCGLHNFRMKYRSRSYDLC